MVRFDFQQKVAIVTGGTKGIGFAIAHTLIRAGARVAITYLRDDKNAAQAVSVLEKGSNTEFIVTRSDIGDRKDTQDLLQMVKNRWHSPISHIVNNAGTLKQGDFFNLTDIQWESTMRNNLNGPFILCQEIIRDMASNGSIVNISSIGGQIGGDRAPDYAASKAGLISLTRSLARIGSAYGVRVNAVAPGWIETPIFSVDQLDFLKKEAADKVPLGRMGTPEDVAGAVLFLLSDAASYITGHCLNVNGGLYMG